MLKKVQNIDAGKSPVQNSFNNIDETAFKRKKQSIELSLQDTSGLSTGDLTQSPAPTD